MASPQDPALERSGTSAVDPASAKSHLSDARSGGDGRRGRLPADNTPGHHPAHEQDKPLEKFVARAEAQAREAEQASDDAEGADEHPGATDSGAAAVDPGARASQTDAVPGDDPEPGAPGAPSAGHLAARAEQQLSGAARGAVAVADQLTAWTRAASPAGGAATTTTAQGLSIAGVPVGAVLPVLSLLDASRRPASAWEEIGESRSTWLARIALLPVLGAYRYSTSVQPRLEAAERARDLAGG